MRYSSSHDVNGPLAHSMRDLHLIFKTIEGHDSKDANCIDFSQIQARFLRKEVKPLDCYLDGIDWSKITVGILNEF